MKAVTQGIMSLIIMWTVLLMMSTGATAGPPASAAQMLRQGVQGARQALSPSQVVAPTQTTYTFETVDVPYPGASWTVPFAINDAGLIVGVYTNATNHSRSFRHRDDGSFYLPVRPNGALDLEVSGISNHQQLVGEYTHPDFTGIRGFWQQQGQRQDITIDQSELVEALGINDLGQVAVTYHDGNAFHGAVYEIAAATFTPADVPGASDTVLFGINNAGFLFGLFVSGNTISGFILNQGTVIPVNVPDADFTIVRGGDEAGLIWGWYGMAGDHGFLGMPDNLGNYTFETIDYPGAEATAILGRNAQGHLVGRYQLEGLIHGFLAIPQ